FIRELFLWAILMNRSDLAMSICSRTTNPVVATLVASKIYHQAATQSRCITAERKLEYLKKEKEFGEHAAGIIDRCFQVDEEFALKLLTQESDVFFKYNALYLAREINSRPFLATKCIQKHLDTEWYGNINYNVYSYTNIMVNYY
ncbi:unnamed protein product, partial [Didymodactylos carnosus]